jgi:DNA-binding XRE family transcriptional regulator
MNENYCVYLHYIGEDIDPFYVGASSDNIRPYDFKSRSVEWITIYEESDKNIRVELIQVASNEEAKKLKNELIEKYKYSICNKSAAALISQRSILLPKGRKALELLGENIKLARLRRRITTAQMAERAGIGRTTYWKIENGDPNVLIGYYISVLFVLGIEPEITKWGLNDPVGRRIQDANLLARVK